MKPLNPYLKKALKEQMLHPMRKCEMYQSYCRFAISDYCLEEHKQFACEFASSVRKEVVTFGKRGEKLLCTLRKDKK